MLKFNTIITRIYRRSAQNDVEMLRMTNIIKRLIVAHAIRLSSSFTTTYHAKRRKLATALLHENPCQAIQSAEEQDDPFIGPSMERVRHVADSIRSHVREYTCYHRLKLVGISAERHPMSSSDNYNFSMDQGADTYSECIRRTCEEDGIDYEAWRVTGREKMNRALQIQKLIHDANELGNVHGILVYYPLFNKPYILGVKDTNHRNAQDWSFQNQQEHIENGCERILTKNKNRWPSICYKTRDDYFRDAIHWSKEVEGLCSGYRSREKFRNQSFYVDRYDGISPLDAVEEQNSTIFPCTALAVMRILKFCLDRKEYDPTKPIGKRFEGVTVTIINRSQIMGRPLASLLANDGACVYSVDEHSIVMIKPGKKLDRYFQVEKNVRSCVEQSSVIVTGVPSSTFRIPTNWIQPNSTVVNVASKTNIDENELRAIPGIRYIPAVGKVTVALLEQNLVQLHRTFFREA